MKVKNKLFAILQIALLLMYVTSKPQEKETETKTEKERILTISEENLKKVYRGLQIEPIPPKLTEDEIKPDTRNLEISLESPSFIPFSTKGIIKSPWYSYYYLFKNIKKTRSNFLIYPYEFTSKNQTGEETDYVEGGYFDIKPGNKTEDSSFTYLKQNTTEPKSLLKNKKTFLNYVMYITEK